MKSAAKQPKQMKKTTTITGSTKAQLAAWRTDLLAHGYTRRTHSERGQRWITYDKGSHRIIFNLS